MHDMRRLHDKSYNSRSPQIKHYHFQSAKARIISQNGLKWPSVYLGYHQLTSLSPSFIYIIAENSVR